MTDEKYPIELLVLFKYPHDVWVTQPILDKKFIKDTTDFVDNYKMEDDNNGNV